MTVTADDAVIVSGFLACLAGVITQNAWYYWRRRILRWLSLGLDSGGALLLTWGAAMARGNIVIAVIAGAAILAVGGTLAFVAFMAGAGHQGWGSVAERMSRRDRRSR